MKVAFFNILNEARNGEQETLMRLQYTFSKQGHTFLLLDKDGYVISEHPDKGLYVEDAGVDYLFTCNGVETSLMVFPDGHRLAFLRIQRHYFICRCSIPSMRLHIRVKKTL